MLPFPLHVAADLATLTRGGRSSVSTYPLSRHHPLLEKTDVLAVLQTPAPDLSIDAKSSPLFLSSSFVVFDGSRDPPQPARRLSAILRVYDSDSAFTAFERRHLPSEAGSPLNLLNAKLSIAEARCVDFNAYDNRIGSNGRLTRVRRSSRLIIY